jgi:hypothetical protein
MVKITGKCRSAEPGDRSWLLATNQTSDAVSEVGSPVQDLIMDSMPPLCIFVMADSGTIAGLPGRGPPNAYLH